MIATRRLKKDFRVGAKSIFTMHPCERLIILGNREKKGRRLLAGTGDRARWRNSDYGNDD
jgi:hypothetical protein